MSVRKATDCTIRIRGNIALVDGEFPLSVVRKATSHYVQGFQFSEAFRKKKWDGRRHFFNLQTKTMPAGLTSLVVEALRKNDPRSHIQILDERQQPEIAEAGFALHGIEFGAGKYDYQLAAANALVRWQRGVLKVATNGGKTEIAAAVIKHLGRPTIFLVESLELLYQTRKRFATRLGVDAGSIGVIGDGEFTVGKWITVATPRTMYNRLRNVEPKAWDVVIADECHHAAAKQFYEVLAQFPAFYRFGLSGTPLDRSDGHDLRLIAQTGPVLYEVSNKVLVDRGISVPPHVDMVKITQPELPANGLNYAQVEKHGVLENPTLNQTAANRAVDHVNEGLQVLILVEKIKQGKLLQKLVREDGVEAAFISGKETTEKRDAVLRRFAEGELRCVVATTILDEGVDVPSIDVLILAAGGKAKIRLLQRVGRGLRQRDGKARLQIVDFANFTHKWLLKHSLMRLRTYREEGCFGVRAVDNALQQDLTDA